jgi:GAF domain-containing protein
MVGSLELAASDPRRFREADKQSLSRVGQHAALAINNARLYEKLLNSIKEISEARKEVARVRRGQYL